MLLEFQQTCPVRSCRGLYPDGIYGPAGLGVSWGVHTENKAVTHRKVDLLNLSRSCVAVHAKDLVGVFWGM
jgi:hypothetical protein